MGQLGNCRNLLATSLHGISFDFGWKKDQVYVYKPEVRENMGPLFIANNIKLEIEQAIKKRGFIWLMLWRPELKVPLWVRVSRQCLKEHGKRWGTCTCVWSLFSSKVIRIQPRGSTLTILFNLNHLQRPHPWALTVVGLGCPPLNSSQRGWNVHMWGFGDTQSISKPQQGHYVHYRHLHIDETHPRDSRGMWDEHQVFCISSLYSLCWSKDQAMCSGWDSIFPASESRPGDIRPAYGRTEVLPMLMGLLLQHLANCSI